MAEQKKDKTGKFLPIGDIPMSRKTIGFRVPQDVQDWLDALPDKTGWLRNLVTEAVRKEMESNGGD